MNDQRPGNLQIEYRCVRTQPQQEDAIVQQRNRRVTTFLSEIKRAANITCTKCYRNLQTAGQTDCKMTTSSYHLKSTFHMFQLHGKGFTGSGVNPITPRRNHNYLTVSGPTHHVFYLVSRDLDSVRYKGKPLFPKISC